MTSVKEKEEQRDEYGWNKIHDFDFCRFQQIETQGKNNKRSDRIDVVDHWISQDRIESAGEQGDGSLIDEHEYAREEDTDPHT